MHTFSSTMPRLFGRAPTPTPAAASVAPAATAATAATASTNAPPRAKLVRKSHMHLAPVPLASRASMASRVSLGSLGSLGSMGSGSVPIPPLSPSSSLSFGLTGPSQGLPLLETHREGSFVSTSAASASASAYEGLLNDYDRSSLSGQRLNAHQHYTVRPQRNVHRAWLSAADARQSSWSGERPPPRKLVKDPNGSARPTAVRELVDDNLRHRVPANLNDDTDKGTLGLRRKMARWRDLRW